MLIYGRKRHNIVKQLSFNQKKKKESESHSIVSDSVTPMDYIVHGILQAKILQWVAFPFSRGSSHPGIEPRSPTLQADSLPAEPPGKPKNTVVGSLSLLQWIFPTQESNWGLLHCRQILYQLSYEGSPRDQNLKYNLDLLQIALSLVEKIYKNSMFLIQCDSYNMNNDIMFK